MDTCPNFWPERFYMIEEKQRNVGFSKCFGSNL